MNARDLNKKIQIWKTVPVPDGFKGSRVTAEKVTDTWANVKKYKVGSGSLKTDMENGISATNNAYTFTIRTRENFDIYSANMYVIYNGFKYYIATYPDATDCFTSFVGTQQLGPKLEITPQ